VIRSRGPAGGGVAPPGGRSDVASAHRRISVIAAAGESLPQALAAWHTLGKLCAGTVERTMVIGKIM
jgi:hypothetical protein